MKRLLLAALCLFAGLAWTAEPSAVKPDSRRLASLLLAAPDETITENALRRPLPAGRARVSLQPMFSAQGGSWPFEPFVHNGLFRIIAGYQPGHPQAVVLQRGSIDLEQLYRTLGAPHILRPHKDGYLLSFPLLIGADAALHVEGKLYLASQTGTALINRGLLSLRHAVVQSWQGDTAEQPEAFRPFIVAWAGSSTLVEQSHLSRLGFKAHLSHGLTLARAATQGDTPPARLLLRDSLVDSLASGLELHEAQALVENNRFESLQQYGLDLRDSQISLLGNRIDQVRNHSGVRLRGHNRGLLKDNLVLRTGKAGIEVLNHQGHLRIRGNRIAQAGTNGIQLHGIATGEPGLELLDNFIANSGYSGLEGMTVGQVWAVGNRIQGAPEYGISLRNPPGSQSRIELHGNQLATVRKAMLRVEGLDQLRMAGNRFQLAPVQEALAGELPPVQSQLMLATEDPHCLVEISHVPAAYPSVRTLDCTPL